MKMYFAKGLDFICKARTREGVLGLLDDWYKRNPGRPAYVYELELSNLPLHVLEAINHVPSREHRKKKGKRAK